MTRAALPRPGCTRGAVVAGLAILVGALAGTAQAGDVVILTSGIRIEGRIVSDDGTTIVIDRTVGGGTSRLTILRTSVQSVQRDAPDAGVTPVLAAPARDEWWLLKSDEKTIGTRHLFMSAATAAAVTPGAPSNARWRFEEHLHFLPMKGSGSVRVDRVEDVTEDFRPARLQYGERGEAVGGPAGAPDGAYEVFVSGSVEGGVWRCTTRGSAAGRADTTRDVPVPPAARTALGMREALSRATPRPLGLVEMPLLDSARSEVRTVRAGFTALDVGAGDAIPDLRVASLPRIDVLRVEDGDRVLESRWGPGDPPRCLSETVAPGVVAVPCTREQALAAEGPPPVAPDPMKIATSRDGSPGPEKDTGPRPLTLPDIGVSMMLPSPAWVAQVVAAQPEDVGPRVVARIEDRLDAADVRVEWDPKGGGTAPDVAERELLARLRTRSPDLIVDGTRRDVPGLSGAWRIRVLGTLRGQRCVTWVLVADRGPGRVTILAACPVESAPVVGPAVEGLLTSFRRL